jgi:hypothetical protein
MSIMTRDMVIEVLNDTVAQSHLSGSFTDTVITPGTPLSLSYTGEADAAYMDSLSAYSGTFALSASPAHFSSGFAAPSVSGSLTWTPGPNQYKRRETRIVAIRSLQESPNTRSNIRAFRVTVVDTSNVNTAITDIGSTQNIFVYPVPATDKLYINSTFPIATASIVDMMGRQWNAKISEEKIDISDLPSGIYLLRWQNQGKTFNRRFIKE